MQDILPDTLESAGTAVAFATRQLIREYDAELAARRAQLVADQALYRAKLVELDRVESGKIDPLGRIYRAHLHAIEALLAQFTHDPADAGSALPKRFPT